jgi:predicted nucleotidyltransferase
MSLPEKVKAKRREILTIAARYGARNVRLFGSIARGEADERSDVDLLVDMEPGRSLLDHAALSIELNRLLDCKVDVISERGLKPRIRERVLKEAVAL